MMAWQHETLNSHGFETEPYTFMTAFGCAGSHICIPTVVVLPLLHSSTSKKQKAED